MYIYIIYIYIYVYIYNKLNVVFTITRSILINIILLCYAMLCYAMLCYVTPHHNYTNRSINH